ncbi:MAG: L,D-transpeptidase family protein [Methylomonas sp.]
MSCMRRIVLLFIFIAQFGSVNAFADQAPFLEANLKFDDSQDTQWIWVDTKHKKVQVMDKDKPLIVFDHAAFGQGGVGLKRKRGDNITPKGIYNIGWNNQRSDFRNFFGLTYPSIQDAQNGLRQKLISESEYQAIAKAHSEHRVPPQNTALGGAVGIHGLGTPLRRLLKHRNSNWTEGCVALNNQQIDELALYVKKGMFVVID